MNRRRDAGKAGRVAPTDVAAADADASMDPAAAHDVHSRLAGRAAR